MDNGDNDDDGSSSDQERDASNANEQSHTHTAASKRHRHKRTLCRYRVSTPKPRYSLRGHRTSRLPSSHHNANQQQRSASCCRHTPSSAFNKDNVIITGYGSGHEQEEEQQQASCSSVAYYGSDEKKCSPLSTTVSSSRREYMDDATSSSYMDSSLSCCYMDALTTMEQQQPFVLPLRETLVYECFLLSLGAVPITVPYTEDAASIIRTAIVSLRNQATIARTIFMQIYSNQILVYNKKKQVTHRLLANRIDMAVTSAESRQLFGVIVSSPLKDHFVCHVFGVDEQLLFHPSHDKYTQRYAIKCTRIEDCSMALCEQFPQSAMDVARYINFVQDSWTVAAPQRSINSPKVEPSHSRRGITRSVQQQQQCERRILSSLSNNIQQQQEQQSNDDDDDASSACAKRHHHLPHVPSSPYVWSSNDEWNSRISNINDAKFEKKRYGYEKNICEYDMGKTSSSNNSTTNNERGECAVSSVRVVEPSGGEVRAKVAVEEHILAKQRTQPSSNSHSFDTFINNFQFYTHNSERLLDGSTQNAGQSKENRTDKREAPHIEEIKDHVEAHKVYGDSLNDFVVASPNHARNSTVTVLQERVADIECTVPMANGEHAHSSGPCSDRSSSDVEKILHNPIYRRPFQQFLEQQFCAENINFYVAVEEYRAIPDSDMERRSKVARQIYEKHFTANSIEPVNIDNSTSKSIRDAVLAQQFSAQLYDVAQYQIFHLLKYDCWPRYLRAGGVAPTFDDATGDEHPGPSTQSSQHQYHHSHHHHYQYEHHRQHHQQQQQQQQQQQLVDKKHKSLLWHGLKPRFSRRKKDTTTSSSYRIGTAILSDTQNCGSGNTKDSPLRQQQRLQNNNTTTTTTTATPTKRMICSPFCVSSSSSNCCSSSIDDALIKRHHHHHRSTTYQSTRPCESFDSIVDQQSSTQLFSSSAAAIHCSITPQSNNDNKIGTTNWSGSKRRQQHFTTTIGKQFSMPYEVSYGQQRSASQSLTTTSPNNRSRQSTAEICTKFCTLMHNEIASSEQIPLNDPTESVGKWTSVMAAKRGMDPRATEAVDAQSLSTIDPARQAMDALNNRCVCLMPVLHFALEIIAPNSSTKTGSTATTVAAAAAAAAAGTAASAAAASNSRIVLLRARHGLSSGVVLRSVLAKFSVDYDACIVVLSGTLEVIASHISVGTIGSRCVTVMTQQQFQERQHPPKRETMKEAPVLAHFLSADANIPFYQHGDVAFFEFPPDLDPRTGKVNAARSYSNAKTEHGSGLLKFVRKASQAVTSREPEAIASSSTHHSHYHSGHNQHSSSMTSSYADKIRRKSVGTFQRTASTAASSDIPYCGENNVPDEQYTKEVEKRSEPSGVSPEPSAGSGGSSVHTPADGRGRVYELPEFLRKENCVDSSSSDTSVTKLRFCAESMTGNANGSTSRIPPIYASAVPSEKDLTPCEVEKAIVWQRADYV